jgi:ERCC4-type nuclease
MKYYYVDCFFYSFLIDENTFKKYKLNLIVMNYNNSKINYLENINYIKCKKNNTLIKTFKSIKSELNNLLIY